MSAAEEAVTRLWAATDQVRICVLSQLAADHPELVLAAIERYEGYLAAHPGLVTR